MLEKENKAGKIRRIVLIAAAVMLALTVFSGVSTAMADNDIKGKAELAGVTWVLKAYGERENLTPALEGMEVTLIFNREDRSAGGSGGVNCYGGDYEAEGNKLVIRDIMQTLIMGPEPAQGQENAFIRILQAAENYEITGGELTITGAAGTLVFTQK